MQLKAQAKLIADTDGGSKGAGLHLSQASRDQQRSGLQRDITHYKKDRLHTVYRARSRRHLPCLNFNDQQSACMFLMLGC
jgi:hypothetical protein